jgi:hypothetical protein
MQVETKPSLSDAFVIMTALARTVAPIGDASLSQLTAHIGARVARLTLDSDPDEIRAIVDMLDACDAAMGRLAQAIDADGADA